MRNLLWLPMAVLVVALLAGPTLAKPGNGGGGGKPGGGGEDPPPPPVPAAPAIAWFESNDLWVMDADGANQTLVLTGAGNYSMSWSGTGNRIAFSGLSTLRGNGIWVLDLDSGALTQPFDAGDQLAIDPAWSAPPAGSGVPEKIVFRHAGALHVMNPDGSDRQALAQPAVPAGTFRNETYPAWAPDGTRFATRFNEWVEEPYVDENGDSRTRLVPTRAGLAIYTLTFGSGGTVTGRTVETIVEVLASASVNPNEIGFTWMDWSPDGTYVAYEDYDETDQQYDLWMIEPDAAAPAPIRLTNTLDVDERSPSWSPDGTMLVFDRRARSRKNSGIHLLDLLTKAETNVGAKSGRFPDWKP